jgi:hypothetical protein
VTYALDMRVAWALLTAAGAVVACSSFSSPTPEAVDGGTDATTPATKVCENAACGSVIARDQTSASEVAVDADAVYWTTDRDGNGLVRRATLGPPIGTPTIIGGPDDHPKSLELYGELLYYATGLAIRGTERQGRPDAGTTLATASTLGPITSLQRVGGWLFYTKGHNLTRCEIAPGNVGCSGGAPELDDTAKPTRALTGEPGGAAVWFANDDGIQRATAAPYERSARWSIRQVQMMAVDATRVYFIRVGEADVFAIDIAATDGSKAVSLAQGAGTPSAIAIDSTHVYFTVVEGRVMKVAKSGGAPIAIATGVPTPRGIAERGDRVYVALGDGRIVSLPKN